MLGDSFWNSLQSCLSHALSNRTLGAAAQMVRVHLQIFCPRAAAAPVSSHRWRAFRKSLVKLGCYGNQNTASPSRPLGDGRGRALIPWRRLWRRRTRNLKTSSPHIHDESGTALRTSNHIKQFTTLLTLSKCFAYLFCFAGRKLRLYYKQSDGDDVSSDIMVPSPYVFEMRVILSDKHQTRASTGVKI